MAEPRSCHGCGSKLSADVPEGLCPECLFQQAVAGPGTAAYREEAGRSPSPSFVPPTPAELARHFPQLEIVRLLGHGGMGAVYLARQPELERAVAIKILPPEVARDSGFMERFSREARALARVNHPNIVTIFDFGTTGGLYYFTMEYVDGKNVRELLRDGALTQPQALKIVAQMCDALQFAHDEGFVHRDIKPENILVDSKGRAKIADFGLARLVGLTPTYLTLTGSSDVMGTLYYMAPEQLKRAHSVDHRADLYSLGVVFYEMLTGELPVGRFSPPSQRAGVDRRLDAIVLQALAREPEHRQQDAAQIKREVEAALSGAPAAPSDSAAPLAVRTIFPCVRFGISNISGWTGANARGEIFRTDTTLILDLTMQDVWGSLKHKELRIPFAEILMISCHTTTPSGWCRWLGVGPKTEIVLKVHDQKILADLPAGQLGRGRLKVHRGDSEPARQLVDSILSTPLPAPVRPSPSQAPPVAGLGGLRRQLVGPAVALLATAVMALPATGGLAAGVALDQPNPAAELYLLVAAAALFATAGSGLMIAGAVQMMRGRSHLLCVAAALLAVLPWSVIWVIGLPAGIWALVVLSRPEVIVAFLDQRRGTHQPPTSDSSPSSPVGGKVQSWLRSFAGYFLTTFPGPRDRQRSARRELDQGGPGASHSG